MLGLLVLVACGPSDGTFDALTYNVAGLPEGLSRSNPERNHITISPRLNAYDLVVVQEDFSYHDRLKVSAKHPFQSTPKETEALIGDGLNRFSNFPLGPLERVKWAACNGTLDASNDCLSEKGFSVSTVSLADGVDVEVFNFHMDAGGGEGDDAARAVQIEQLLEAIAARDGAAIILAGDTNLHTKDALDVPRLERIMAGGDVACACEAVSCREERIDRFFFRSGSRVVLTPESWAVPEGFVDAEGAPLSDHAPVSVRFSWRLE